VYSRVSENRHTALHLAHIICTASSLILYRSMKLCINHDFCTKWRGGDQRVASQARLVSARYRIAERLGRKKYPPPRTLTKVSTSCSLSGPEGVGIVKTRCSGSCQATMGSGSFCRPANAGDRSQVCCTNSNCRSRSAQRQVNSRPWFASPQQAMAVGDILFIGIVRVEAVARIGSADMRAEWTV
jgi:hypothetical protein